MKILGLHIVTDRDLTAMVQIGAASLAERRASAIAKRYARNPNCLAAMFAARHGLKPEHAFLTDSLMDIEARAVTAFAEAMGRERNEAA